jgi:hypothetical protein
VASKEINKLAGRLQTAIILVSISSMRRPPSRIFVAHRS